MNGLLGVFLALFASIAISAHPGPSESPELVQLRSFLAGKASPIPAQVLVRYPNWRMIVALSAAESSYGKRMAGTHNAWGIKDYRSGSLKFRGTRDFESWEESIKFTSELLYKYDPQDGEPSPWGMVRSWKYVQPYGHWVRNVSYSLYDIGRNVVVA